MVRFRSNWNLVGLGFVEIPGENRNTRRPHNRPPPHLHPPRGYVREIQQQNQPTHNVESKMRNQPGAHWRLAFLDPLSL